MQNLGQTHDNNQPFPKTNAILWFVGTGKYTKYSISASTGRACPFPTFLPK